MDSLQIIAQFNYTGDMEVACFYVIDDKLEYVSFLEDSTYYLYTIFEQIPTENLKSSNCINGFDAYVYMRTKHIVSQVCGFVEYKGKDTRIIYTKTSNYNNVPVAKNKQERKIIVKEENTMYNLFEIS